MPAHSSVRLVALSLPPGADFIAALDDAWRRGDAVMPVDPSAPRAVVDRLLAIMQPDLPVDAEVALVIATSGSTGEPKGVQLTAAALEASARATHERIGLERTDRWLACLPWHHIGGLQVLLRSRLLDIPLEVHDQFDIARVAASDATLVALVPTQLARLLEAGVDVSRFRVILLGGSAASRDLLGRARAAGANVVTTYGMSETSGGCVYDGHPLSGVDLRLGEDLRIQLRGPMVMSGYRLRPDLTAQMLVDGWLVTADLGHLDPDGRLTVTGRVDDVIITGGENVVASQVALVLSAHPALAEVVVTGVADPEWGERVVAVAVVRPGSEPPSLAELRDWSVGRLTAAARPRAVILVDELPMLRSGKPDRLAISRLAAAPERGA